MGTTVGADDHCVLKMKLRTVHKSSRFIPVAALGLSAIILLPTPSATGPADQPAKSGSAGDANRPEVTGGRTPSSGLENTPSGGTIPGGPVPGGTLPGGTVPGGRVPGGTLPGGTVPGGTVPNGTLPGGTVPGGTVPSEKLPGEDG